MANFSQSYNTEENMSILYFALDNVSEAAYLTDDKGNFLYINTEACFKLGYARNELLKMNVLSIDSNFDKEKWSVHWNALKKEKSLIFESTHKTKEGKIIPVEINANFFMFDKKMFNLGLVRDITERKNKEQKHQTFLNYLSIMDRINKVIQSSNDLEQVINDVLDTVISIFTSDRAFLLYPLDIEADSWSLPKIRYREDFPVRIPENLKLTMLTETKKAFKVILDSKSPISFGPGTEYPTPPRAVNEFKVISMLAMPVFPKTGKPWMFGIQQCSYQRIWSPEEKEIFEQIGMRVSDALSILLSYRNLQQSESKFRQIIETSNEGIMILDVEGRIAFANKHMSEMLGYAEKEIIGHLKSEFVFKEEKNDHYIRLEHRKLNLSENYERKFLRKDGKILWTLASATPLLSDSGEFTGSFAMFSDITERKEFELALQESEWRYHEIFDNVLDSLYLLEVTDDGHFRNLELNPAFEKSTGLSRKELLGKITEETVSPENAAIANAKYKHCIEAGHPIEEDVVFDLPVGQRYYHSTLIPARDEKGEINRIIGISRDVTNQKIAELEIKKLNRLYKMLASCNETLVHEKNENELLNKICQIIVDEGKYIMAWVGYAVNDEEFSVRPVAHAGKENGYLTNIKISWADNNYGRGPTGKTIRTGRISTSKFHSDSDFNVWRGEAETRHYESSSAFPLTIENKTFGALNIYSEFQDTFDESELTLLQELANDLAFGIQKMKIEAELRQSESRFRVLYNNTPVMLHSIDNEGKLISVSDYWLDTMGYTREEVLGHHVTEFLTEKSAEYLSKFVLPDFLEKGYCYNVEYQFVKRNGNVLDTILSAISEQGDEGKVLRSMAVITDITDRKKMEQALRESEEKYRTLIQKIQAAVVVHAPDTKILTSNSLAEDLLGLSKEQLLGKTSIDPVWHFSHEDGQYVSIDEHPVNLVISSQKKVRNYVLKIYRPNLETDIWVLVNADPVFNKEGKLIQVIVTFIDITERKKAEMELEEERKLFIGGPNVAFKWKAVEGWPIEYVSPNIAKQFGYSPEYLMRSNIKYVNLIHPDDLKYIMNEIENYNQKQLLYFELEYRIMRADGEYRWVYNFITIVRDSFGEITYYQGHVTDITEERRSKDEIQKLNLNLEKRVKERTLQLESLNKELEAFSYSVSHDLRAPLFRIDGYIELLKEKIGDTPDKEVKGFLEHITKSSKDMSQLIDDILSFSRLGYQEIHTSTIDMNSLVRDVILEFKPEIKERIIQWNISNLPSIDGDKTLIHQVLTNLFSNALKFTLKKDKAIIDIGTIFSKTEYIFFIKDNGAGFDMKNASKLFSAFQRLHSKDEFEGTGIGLANVRRIINRHGGRCWAEGKVNEGAIFYFSLPKD